MHVLKSLQVYGRGCALAAVQIMGTAVEWFWFAS